VIALARFGVGGVLLAVHKPDHSAGSDGDAEVAAR
jgi:hypothetical protein